MIYRTEEQMDHLASRIDPATLRSRQSFRANDPYIAYLELERAD